MDCAAVHQPENITDSLAEAEFFVLTSDRVKGLILDKIARLIGRPVPDSKVEIIDWNYRFDGEQSNVSGSRIDGLL
jgi:hypothetical protein